MRRIHVVGNKQVCFTRHLFPLRVYKNTLYDNGIIVKYFADPRARGIEECDTLIFFEAKYRDILPIKKKDRSSALDYLNHFFEKFDKVIWFDDHDSSGMLRTYVFPHVDVYLKAQILRDRNYYHEPHLMGIKHRDYVHENYKINDSQQYKGDLTDHELQKLQVGWNLSLVNWQYFLSDSSLLKQLIYLYSSTYRLVNTNISLDTRKNHISYRANMWRQIPTVNWWRNSTQIEIDKFISSHPNLTINTAEKIKMRDYYDELTNTIVVPSPFGVGEICYRDFECFMSGALLLKPSMEHIQTWPNLYIDGQTYISHKWDFSDFIEKLIEILEKPNNYEDIAKEGRSQFQKALSDGASFVQHFLEAIN